MVTCFAHSTAIKRDRVLFDRGRFHLDDSSREGLEPSKLHIYIDLEGV